ncbi:MAG: hypothetical protein ABIR80_12810 [Opitutaceae bacterium]
MHDRGLLLAQLAPFFRACRLRRGETSAAKQPRAERWVLRQRRRLARQIDQDSLRHILREVPITAHTP